MLTRAPRLSLLTVLALLAGLVATPARAYTPESGVWWNPNEPGTGLILDLQDNFLAVSLFIGTPGGTPTWYTATGFLTGNARFDAELDYFPGAQCLGCNFRPVSPQLGEGGPMRILFDLDDPARATLTIAGRTTQIERFRFYFKRPEDEQQVPGVPGDLTRLMGEWQAVLDYSNTGDGPAFYLGDVLIFDFVGRDSLGYYVDGCRPAESLGGFCSDSDLELRYAVADYEPSTRTHVIVVENSPSTFASYFVELGTNEFIGTVSVHNVNTIPTVFLPTRGFRSASRTFVQDGSGPSRKLDDTKASIGLPLVESGPGASEQRPRSKAEQQALDELHDRLQAQLAARRAKR